MGLVGVSSGESLLARSRFTLILGFVSRCKELLSLATSNHHDYKTGSMRHTLNLRSSANRSSRDNSSSAEFASSSDSGSGEGVGVYGMNPKLFKNPNTH